MRRLRDVTMAGVVTLLLLAVVLVMCLFLAAVALWQRL